MPSDDVGHVQDAPSGDVREVIDPTLWGHLWEVANDPRYNDPKFIQTVVIQVGTLRELLSWLQTLDGLHKIDHSLADQRLTQLANIDRLIFGSSHPSLLERERRLAKLVSQDRHPSREKTIEDYMLPASATELTAEDKRQIAQSVVDTWAYGNGYLRRERDGAIQRTDPRGVTIVVKDD